MTGRVIDLGAGDDPDPRATETADLFADANLQFDLEEEWPLGEASVDGLICRHTFEHLADPAHFFGEAGRVLRDDGWLEVTVPLGRDARTDPDHEQEWTYWSPKMYCRRHRAEADRPWDTETPFVLDDRDLNVWLFGPFAPLSGVFNFAAERWPHWAARRCGAGELTARYRRVAR